MTAVYVVLAVVVVVAWWQVDVRRHPTRRCPRCHGRKVNAGSTRLKWGECSRCAGTGHVRRIGARRQ